MTANQRLLRIQGISFGLGIFMIVASLPAAFYDSQRFLQSYLFAYLFWLEITLGSMAMLMVYVLTNGGWGAVMRQILQSSMKTMYPMAFVFLPIVIFAQKIYPWADPAKITLNDYPHKQIYYSLPFFSGRSALYLVSWIVIAFLLDRLLCDESTKNRRGLAVRLSAGALVYLGFSVSWASIDWQMSLDTLWHSTIYGLVFAVGQALGAWAFTILVCYVLIRFYEPSITLSRKIELDLGNLLLTMVILWAYLSFMQYLIVWAANLPDEVTWFYLRTNHGWGWLALLIVVFQFAAPFSALLFRNVKTRANNMIIITIFVIAIRIVDRYWMVMPAFSQQAVSLAYVDATILLGLGGLWIGWFVKNLRSRPLFAKEDPNWPKADEVLAHA